MVLIFLYVFHSLAIPLIIHLLKDLIIGLVIGIAIGRLFNLDPKVIFAISLIVTFISMTFGKMLIKM